MKRNARYLVNLAIGLVLSLLLLAGCGSTSTSSTGQQSANDQITQPVTLTVDDLLFTDQEWQNYVVDPIQKKYPNVTLQRITRTSKFQDLVSSGQMPDLIFGYISSAQDLTGLGYPQDLTDLIKKHNTDVSVIDPVITDAIKKYSDKGVMMAMPLYSNIQVMFYNKDIFDKFGVSYPTDNMTYDQVLNIARSLTRTADGVNYVGLNPGGLSFQLAQLSLNYIDKKTSNVIVNQQEGFKKIFNFDQALYNIPGMQQLATTPARDAFYKTQNLAMNVDWLSNNILLLAKGQTVNWDIVTMPANSDRPGIQSMTDFHCAYLSSSSQNKDAAYAVMSYLSTSKEVQTLLVRGGRPTVLKDKSINSQFAADIDFFKGKNIAAVANTHMAPLRDVHPLENAAGVSTALGDALNNVVKGNQDVNSALNQAAETISKNLVKARQQQ